MHVCDVMSSDVVTIEESASCCEAIERMTRRKIRHLPVVGADGTVRGIVTDRDLRHHLFEPDVFRNIGSVTVETLLKAVPVSEVMSSPVISVGPDQPLEDAARIMLEDKVGSLPVVERGHVVGILTETDLLKRIVGADAGCAEVESIIVSYP